MKSTKEYSLMDFIVVTMHGKLFISSAADMEPREINGEEHVEGYYYDLSDEIALRVDNNKLIVSANAHPNKTAVPYQEYQVTDLNQSSINSITINESTTVRKIQISKLTFDGTTFIIGTTDICYS